MLLSLTLLTHALLAQQPEDPQSAPGGVEIRRATSSPRYAGTYHPATGLTPATRDTRRSPGPDLIFNTLPLANYYTVHYAHHEVIDEGVLRDRSHDHREQINGFEHIYCSAPSAPSAVELTTTFYDENVYCAGPPDWPTADCSYVLSGLPGGDPNGNVQCWIIRVDLAGFECDLTTDPQQNRMFGWGTAWDNDATGPWHARGDHGSTDVYVVYDHTAPNASAAFQGCWWWGGQPRGDFAIRLWGNPPEAFAYSSASGPGADDRLSITLDGEAQVGNTVVASVTDSGAPVSSILWASPARVDRNLGPVYGIDAHLLADHAQRVLTSRSPSGDHTLTVPAAAGGGRTWYLQAATGMAGAPTAMSHGLELSVF